MNEEEYAKQKAAEIKRHHQDEDNSKKIAEQHEALKKENVPLFWRAVMDSIYHQVTLLNEQLGSEIKPVVIDDKADDKLILRTASMARVSAEFVSFTSMIQLSLISTSMRYEPYIVDGQLVFSESRSQRGLNPSQMAQRLIDDIAKHI